MNNYEKRKNIDVFEILEWMNECGFYSDPPMWAVTSFDYINNEGTAYYYSNEIIEMFLAYKENLKNKK